MTKTYRVIQVSEHMKGNTYVADVYNATHGTAVITCSVNTNIPPSVLEHALNSAIVDPRQLHNVVDAMNRIYEQ